MSFGAPRIPTADDVKRLAYTTGVPLIVASDVAYRTALNMSIEYEREQRRRFPRRERLNRQLAEMAAEFDREENCHDQP